MSANALMVAILSVLAVLALIVRLALGPLPAGDYGAGLYVAAKAGPASGALATRVEIAARGAR